jgi:toxin ParE1/3/4
MPAFCLSNLAKLDMQVIGRYTQVTWGREQRNLYLQQLDNGFHLLARDPARGQQCDDIRPGYRKYPIGRHVVFYRVSDAGVEIVRILHDRMDLPTHMGGG